MLRRPDLVERGSIKKTAPAKNGAPAREFWDPNVIGKNYRIRRICVPQGSTTHMSPRGHWVRGYVTSPMGHGAASTGRSGSSPIGGAAKSPGRTSREQAAGESRREWVQANDGRVQF